MPLYSILLLFYFLVVLIFTTCQAKGSFELRLISLDYGPKGEFRTEVQLCLKQFQREIKHNGECLFGERTVEVEALRRGIKLNFNFTWPGSFTLIPSVWRNNGSIKELVFSEGFQREGVDSSSNWIEEELSDENGFRMRLAFRITCQPHYYGPSCSTHCIPMSNSFSHHICTSEGVLKCAPGWKGERCDIAECPGCVHGDCKEPERCECRRGWQGPNCDQCLPHSECKYGTCDLPGECKCKEGWGGLFCSEDLIYCTRHEPCKNGATCRNADHGGFTCECAEGFTGERCEERKQNCSSNPCLNNGICTDVGGSFLCTCPSGWTGTTCSVRKPLCAPNICKNGKCVENKINRSYHCICESGFAGKHCDERVPECKGDNPCKNGGTCIDEGDNLKCKCPNGFTGVFCEEEVDACLREPCLNNGRCISLKGGNFRCECAPGFRGTWCDIERTACSSQPCWNGGVCESFSNDYRCHCPPCFSGKNCTQKSPDCKQTVFLSDGTRSGTQQKLADGLHLRDTLLIGTSVGCVLLLILVAMLVYRKKCWRPTINGNPEIENAANARKQQKYSEQKSGLSICANVQNDISYYEKQQPYKFQVVDERRNSTRLSPERCSEYSQRYAQEPSHRNSNVFSEPPPGYDKVPPQYVERRNGQLAINSSAVPLKDGDSVYEEIPDVHTSSHCVNLLNPNKREYDINLLNYEASDRARRNSQRVFEAVDLQTNL